MSQKLIRDISASTTQVILNQFLGLIVFLITSRYLDKAVYGELNWSIAVLTFITTILSLRLEQIVVKKVAAGEDPSKLLTLFTGHVVFAGLGFYLLLALGTILFPSFFQTHNLLLVLAISHLLGFFSSPYKQLANGLERFRILALMSTVSNLLRAGWLALAICLDTFTIRVVLGIFIFSALAELVVCYLLARYSLQVSFSFQSGWNRYISLIRESLPMAGTVVLHATIARIDWILIGLFTTAQQTAEYSFAYRIFELSPVPLLIIAPVLLARFSRFFSKNKSAALIDRRNELDVFIRFSMITATTIPLVLNMVWAPLMDTLTHNKYGAVNTTTFLLLSAGTPFLYMNNILWTVELGQNRLKRILHVTLLSFLIILVGNLLFIPGYAAAGAAAVYLGAVVIEYFNYLRRSAISFLPASVISPFACLTAAFAAGWLARVISAHAILSTLISLALFSLLLLATKQLRKSDWKHIRDLRQRGSQPLHEQTTGQPS